MAFQTSDDLRKEERVARLLEQQWDCKMISIAGAMSPFDRMALRDKKPMAVVEIKCRTYPSNAFKTVFMSLRKAMDLITAKNALRSMGWRTAEAVYVWKFADGKVGYLPLSDKDLDKYDVEMQGRTDRGAQNDIEPMVMIPKSVIAWIP